MHMVDYRHLKRCYALAVALGALLHLLPDVAVPRDADFYRVLVLDFAPSHFSAREAGSKSRPCPKRQAPFACLL